MEDNNLLPDNSTPSSIQILLSEDISRLKQLRLQADKHPDQHLMLLQHAKAQLDSMIAALSSGSPKE